LTEAVQVQETCVWALRTEASPLLPAAELTLASLLARAGDSLRALSVLTELRLREVGSALELTAMSAQADLLLNLDSRRAAETYLATARLHETRSNVASAMNVLLHASTALRPRSAELEATLLLEALRLLEGHPTELGGSEGARVTLDRLTHAGVPETKLAPIRATMERA
jgi:hypothetical protein